MSKKPIACAVVTAVAAQQIGAALNDPMAGKALVDIPVISVTVVTTGNASWGVTHNPTTDDIYVAEPPRKPDAGSKSG
jgi:hypothetical protein